MMKARKIVTRLDSYIRIVWLAIQIQLALILANNTTGFK